METNQRIFGLDFIRVAAIAMVLLAQSIWILPQSGGIISQLASLFHFIGLEIFFVLSGFLLGNEVYKLLLQENFGWLHIRGFLKKRAVQILPLYFFILLINIGIASLIGYSVDQGWKYFLLLQNFASPMGVFFSESWGLPIIVFATILFPVALLLLNKAFRFKSKSMLFLMTTLLLIVAFLISKIIYNSNTTYTNINQWDVSLKSVLIYRCDAIFIGVLFSWILHNYHSSLNKIKIPLAFLGCVGIAFIFAGVGYFQLLIENHKLFWNVIYLPLTSLSIALFLPILNGWKTTLSIIKGPIFFISNMTYAIYMVYFGIAFQLMFSYFSGTKSSMLNVVFYLLTVFALGILFHTLNRKAIERIFKK